jgi:2-amino-1-hydroxyethylphosphonate dioxygenase (glycine-forming)
MRNRIEETVEEVFGLYVKYGEADYIGEPVSQLEHMSQSAELAMKEGFDDEVVLAAFFHDIGHICVMHNEANAMGGYGVKSHEKIGADYLRKTGFPEKVARLVENHVQAKRYLTFKYPDYYNNLSEASKKTLEFQGGIMTPEEAGGFEKDALFEISILMRKWDELAKEINIPVLDLSQLKTIAAKVLAKNSVNELH